MNTIRFYYSIIFYHFSLTLDISIKEKLIPFNLSLKLKLPITFEKNYLPSLSMKLKSKISMEKNITSLLRCHSP